MPRSMATVSMAAVSVAEALVTGASEATDFSLLAFSEGFYPGYYGGYYPATEDTGPAI